jgi:enoyl-CoA hydratase/carnithine racemase
VVKKPVIAAINGKALGGGFELALMCDIIVSSDKSYFGFPEINLGLMPGLGGTQRLTKIVGEKRAMMCILSGGGFTAEEAFSLNLAIPVPSEKFSEHVQKIA